MKKTWEGINDVLHRRKKTKLITALKDPNNGNKIVKEPSQIPTILNELFASVGNRLASKISTSQQHYLNYVSHCKSPTSSFLFQPVTPVEVKFQVLSIPNNKSYGLYSSPIKLLKCASSIMAPILSEIFNISVTVGSRDGAVVRALASHQCGPGSIPGLGVICGLSLLLVLVLAPRGFSPGTPVFPSPQKPTFLNSNSIWKVSPISAVRAKYI